MKSNRRVQQDGWLENKSQCHFDALAKITGIQILYNNISED